MDKLYENEVISLTLGDWTWNASVTGFINIVGQGNVSCNGSTVEIPVRCLKNFEERYFKYFIDTYEKTLPWYKLVYFKKTIENHRENEFKNLNLQGLKGINTYIKDTAKRYLTGNSIKSAFELMGIAERIQQLEKGLEKIKEPKDEAAFEKEKPNVVEEVKKQFEILNEILEYCGSDSGRRFIGAKNVIYAVIKNGWNGVCFLNPQTKIKDMYEDYRTYFVDEAVNYINSCDKKYKFRCFTCGSPIKDFSNDMSFINQSGFDVARKPSHVWNFTNDIALCPVCKLVYSCLPAGFAYVNDTGLYINANINMLYNIRVNSNVKASVNDIGIEQNLRKIYRVLVEAMKNQQLERQKYELADVQVVRYKNESYKFNLLPESTIKLINDFSEKIEGLIKTNYKEGKESYSIYELVLEHILNNQNLFLLINKLLHYKIST
ncbi:MAG TPA: Cas8a1 family CRISPR/Cas system-associated protein, partial [Ruminiclostridium sp.]|nr:Cas8a1 family CRISPR/Cas system-associated protein [Ruminiclostridium sp.]